MADATFLQNRIVHYRKKKNCCRRHVASRRVRWRCGRAVYGWRKALYLCAHVALEKQMGAGDRRHCHDGENKPNKSRAAIESLAASIRPHETTFDRNKTMVVYGVARPRGWSVVATLQKVSFPRSQNAT